MNLKRISAAALAAVLAATLLPAALADGTPDVVVDNNVIEDVNHRQGDIMLINAPMGGAPLLAIPTVGVGYTTQLYMNGEALDTSAIPAAADKMVPLRLIAEADGGSADWFPVEYMSYFFLENARITVRFADCSIEVNGDKVEGTAALIDGVTFVPAGVLDLVEGYSVSLSDNRVDIATPNGDPFTKLVKGIVEEVGMAASMKVAVDELEYFGIDADNFVRFMGFAPMNIRADHIFVAQYAEGADKAAAKEQFEERLKGVQNSFEFYLPDAYEMSLKGQVVESEDGEWLMLIISDDNAKAIEMFEAGVAALAQTPEVPLPKEPIFVMPVPQV